MDRALSLARQGFYVFPVNGRKRPLTPHGHFDATTDPETIATWWTLDFPDALVAVHCGRSKLVVLDLDRHNEDADGFVSIQLGWLEIPQNTWSYTTTTNEGEHIWLRAPEHLELPSKPNYQGMHGVDRKSGSGYVVVWATQIPDTIRLAPAPMWLLDGTPQRGTGDTFEGGLDDYLATLADGEPADKVLAAIERIPEDFDHNEMVARQMELVRLGAEGKIGVKVALDILRESWTRAPYDDEDHRYEFDAALETCIKKYGAAEDRIQALPLYQNVLNKLGSSSLDRLVGKPQPKQHYFDTIRHLVAQSNLTDDDVASLIWNAPATAISREWGIDYLYGNIGNARIKANAPIENPVTGLDHSESSHETVSLLTDDERAAVEAMGTFPDAYLDWAATKVNVLNEPYHRQNALTIMSLAFGMRVFAPKAVGPLGVNLFQIGLGESSTGKNESINLRDQVLDAMFEDDPTFDFGSSPSPEALQEALLKRDLQCSLFHTDEAAAPFNEFLNKSYAAGLVDRLTSYYEGRVTPMLRRGNNGAATNQRATVSFNMAMFGTPDRVISMLNRDQFMSGFLARFLWCISDTIEVGDEQYEESEADGVYVDKADPQVAAFASTFGRRPPVGSTGAPVPLLPAAKDRLTLNRKLMTEAYQGHEQWDIIEPSIKRLGDNIRKISTLLAATEGDERVEEHHVLAAISHAEEYLHNLEIVAEKISASVFERNCNEVEMFVQSQGGSCAMTRVFHKFKGWELKDTVTAVEGLVQQGRVKRQEENAQRGAWIELNRNGN